VKAILQSATARPTVSGTDRLQAVYQLKIHLLGISPQISRRVLVRGDTTLAELHHIFQMVMGWDNWHLHSFKLWGKEYGVLPPTAVPATPVCVSGRRACPPEEVGGPKGYDQRMLD